MEDQNPSKKINIPALVGVVVVCALLLLGIFMLIAKKDNTLGSSTKTKSKATLRSITKSEIEKHATKLDCWTIISGSVYDITPYVPRHPGGDDILLACGTEGTSLFTERKTSTGESVGSGSGHSSNAESQLSSLKIGTLVQ